MATRALTKSTGMLPTMFEEFFRPWDEVFETKGLWGRVMNVPAANIVEKENEYSLSLAAPGMKNTDFKIDIDGNMLTVSAELEEKKEEKTDKYTKEEFNYSTFTRCFTLPDEVIKEKIEALYVDGILKLTLPKKEEFKKAHLTKHVAVK